jgi:hypothetical protein
MPFSAATGLIEAALAAGTTTNDQTQAICKQTAVNVPNRPGQTFDSPREASKDMKIFSPFRVAQRPRNAPKV